MHFSKLLDMTFVQVVNANKNTRKDKLQQNYFINYVRQKLQETKEIVPIEIYNLVDDVYFLQNNFSCEKYSD